MTNSANIFRASSSVLAVVSLSRNSWYLCNASAGSTLAGGVGSVRIWRETEVGRGDNGTGDEIDSFGPLESCELDRSSLLVLDLARYLKSRPEFGGGVGSVLGVKP